MVNQWLVFTKEFVVVFSFNFLLRKLFYNLRRNFEQWRLEIRNLRVNFESLAVFPVALHPAHFVLRQLDRELQRGFFLSLEIVEQAVHLVL